MKVQRGGGDTVT